jgi:hypothetical protein
MRAVVLVSLFACGGSSTPKPPPAPSGPPAPMIATPASAEDVVVASVNGKPVYGSCVVGQAARGATKQVALDECISFELLAQQAEAYATDPEVVHETKRALVSQFIAREYEDKYTSPKDFGPAWDKFVEVNKVKIEHGEARASAYVRLVLPKKATPEQEAAAKVIADDVAAKLRDERGLTATHLKALGEQIVGTRGKVEVGKVPAYLNNGGLVKPYADALFAIPEVGRTSGVVRTSWGWDVILLTELIPAEKLSHDEAVAKMLPELKRSYFGTWAKQVARAVSVKLFDENLPKLEDL